MTVFLRELVAKLEDVRVDGASGPDGEVDPHDHVVGVMSDDMKRLYVFQKQECDANLEYFRAIQHRLVDAEIAGTLDDVFNEDVKARLSEANVRMDALKRIFWASLRTEHPALNTHFSIGVRKNWQVVWTDDEAEKPTVRVVEVSGAVGTVLGTLFRSQ